MERWLFSAFWEVAARLPNQRLLLLWRMPLLKIWRRVQRGQLSVSLEAIRAVSALLYSETFSGELDIRRGGVQASGQELGGELGEARQAGRAVER